MGLPKSSSCTMELRPLKASLGMALMDMDCSDSDCKERDTKVRGD